MFRPCFVKNELRVIFIYFAFSSHLFDYLCYLSSIHHFKEILFGALNVTDRVLDTLRLSHTPADIARRAQAHAPPALTSNRDWSYHADSNKVIHLFPGVDHNL